MSAGAALAVQQRRPGVSVRFEPRPGRLLELVEDLADLRVGRAVVRSPGDHGRRVLSLELQRVGAGRHHGRISVDDLDARAQLPAASRSPTRFSAAARAEPLPRARNLTCIASLSAGPGNREQRPLDGDQMGDHHDGLGRRGV